VGGAGVSASARVSAASRSCTRTDSTRARSPGSSSSPAASYGGARAQEAGFRRFARVDRFVGSVLNARDTARPVPTTITCALDEENYGCNAALAHALAAQGYPVDFHAARGGHDWPTWRRAAEAHLPTLLRRVWR